LIIKCLKLEIICFAGGWRMRSRGIRPEVFVIAILLPLAVATARAQKVEIGYDKSADFSQYKTYSMIPRTFPATNPLLATLINNDIEAELQKKGLRKVDSDPDLLVKSYGGADDVAGGIAAEDPTHAATGGDPMPGATVWGGSLPATPVPQVMHGSITVDLFDARQKHLVWRATAKGKMDYDKRSKLLEQANKAVSKMFEKYPPSK
jgi:hypothetical protein